MTLKIKNNRTDVRKHLSNQDRFIQPHPDRYFPLPSIAKITLQLYADPDQFDNEVKYEINKFKHMLNIFLNGLGLKANYDHWKNNSRCSGKTIEYNLNIHIPDICIKNRDQIPVQACHYWHGMFSSDFNIHTSWALYTGSPTEKDIILGSINQALKQRKRPPVQNVKPLVQDDEKICKPLGLSVSHYFPCGIMDHLIENKMLNFYGKEITLQFAEEYDAYLAGQGLAANYKLIDMYKRTRYLNGTVDESLKPGQKYGFQITFQHPDISGELKSTIIEWGVFCWCRILVKYCRDNDVCDLLP